MSKFIITPELSETLRNVRLQNNIQAKSLASHINKSPAYISKLEHGEIQTIDSEQLLSIIDYIFVDTTDKNELLDKIYNSLKIKYTNKDIENLLWFTNFDTVLRELPIPMELIEYINSLLIEHNISIKQLLFRINSNEHISEEDKCNPDIPENLWYTNNRDEQCIKIKMQENDLVSILHGETDTTSYINLLSIIFYTLKIINYKDKIDIPNDEYKMLLSETTDILNNHKFYSIIEKNKILSEKQANEDISDILNSFERENAELISDIFTTLHVFSQLDIKRTNLYLSDFNKNLTWDTSFLLRIISLEYTKLDKTSVSNKRLFIEELRKLIDEFAQIPDDKNKIEVY